MQTGASEAAKAVILEQDGQILEFMDDHEAQGTLIETVPHCNTGPEDSHHTAITTLKTLHAKAISAVIGTTDDVLKLDHIPLKTAKDQTAICNLKKRLYWQSYNHKF